MYANITFGLYINEKNGGGGGKQPWKNYIKLFCQRFLNIHMLILSRANYMPKASGPGVAVYLSAFPRLLS